MDYKVIIVDDDAVVLFLHKNLIEKNCLVSPVHSFKNGKAAFDFILENRSQEDPFLVLLDINMPVMNGWEFLDKIQEEKLQDKIFVAMVSSSVNASDLDIAKSYPQVIDYLEKPLRKDACNRLFHKMERLIQS